MSGRTPTTVTAFIVVFKEAYGLDWAEKRHTCLTFRFADQSPMIVVHAAGSTRDYRTEMIDDYDPRKSENSVGTVDLGELLVQILKERLVSFVSKTPVDNTIDGWNCQNWIGDVLERMADAGYIARQTWDRGLDEMVDIVIDAKDEHLR